MCQISFNNTGNDELNKQLFLIESSLGAVTQKHGWGGFGTKTSKEYVKCEIPANFTLNSGELLKNHKGVFMGHIRSASFGVPVILQNAHPFTDENVFQFHNGTLTPIDDTKFTTKYTVEEKDDKGVAKSVEYKVSDSLIFFNRFIEIYNGMPKKDRMFMPAFQETMKEFYGKFAFTYYIADKNEMYVIRGKTADLYISYILSSERKDAKVLGYCINTSSGVLEDSLNILSNLEQLSGRKPVYYTRAKELEKETIYLAQEKDIVKIGVVTENPTPVKSYTNYQSRSYYGDDWQNGVENFTIKGEVNYASISVVKYGRAIFDFCQDYSISVKEISGIFYGMYGCSILDASEACFKHFCNKVLESLKKETTKVLRKRLKSSCDGRFDTSLYNTYEFPWMLNPKTDQIKMIEYMEAARKERK